MLRQETVRRGRGGTICGIAFVLIGLQTGCVDSWVLQQNRMGERRLECFVATLELPKRMVPSTTQTPVITICTAQWSLYVQTSGHYMYSTVVTICTAQWSLYVPPV